MTLRFCFNLEIIGAKSQDALAKDLPARIVNVWASIASMLM
jgi:hypothetical protein